MKKIILSLVLTLVFAFSYAQTNVSGGIFSNTTWTVTGSPYIVVDTTVVFPGVTLTIEPGVLVKFDNHKYLEIRQGTLIANGTITDSITFTSNNPSPTPGIWGHASNGGLWFNGASSFSFNYINISYATYGLRSYPIVPSIKNSSFTYNQTGIQSINAPVDSCVFKYNETAVDNIVGSSTSVILNFCTMSNNDYGVYDLNKTVWNNCTIDSNNRPFGGATGSAYDSKFYNCSISNNNSGYVSSGWAGTGSLLKHCVLNYNTTSAVIMGMGSNSHDSIIDCEIKYNGTGVSVGVNTLITRCDIEYDTVGIKLSSSAANIYCNKICNNVSYGLQMTSSANCNVDDNYWCTNDSTQIAAAIYDGYDNVNFGLVTFLPVDSTCYQSTGIYEDTYPAIGFSIFPNPSSGIFQITFPSSNTNQKTNYTLEVVNTLGQTVFERQVRGTPLPFGEGSGVGLNVSFLPKGIYVLKINDGITAVSSKFVIE
jgi:hypothetical protein